MIRKVSFISFVILIVIVISSVSSHAYTMADYWAFNEGTTWIYNRGFNVMGTETHNFAQFTGRQFLQADTCDQYPYIYSGSEGVLVVGMYSFDNNQFVDLSATPIKLSNAEMSIGESVTNNFPAGVIDDGEISITITLEAVESVTVPAGTYNNALRLNVFVVDGVGNYTEKIWLANSVGPVKMYRVSETNNTSGCFMTCGSFACDGDTVVERHINLKSIIKGGKKKVVVIPLN